MRQSLSDKQIRNPVQYQAFYQSSSIQNSHVWAFDIPKNISHLAVWAITVNEV